MFYTAAWCYTNDEDFKKAIPFELLGESIKKYGSTIPFTIVLLEGIDLISSSYLNELENWGFKIINYTEEFKVIINRYKAIATFYSKYERNCFLRWIAFNQILKSNSNNSQFWHLDSDVVLHTSLDSLADDTLGKTFMLQGCPVFVSISDFNWFDSYERELDSLEADIHGYSAIAMASKDVFKNNDPILANDSLFRYPIGSDQDLLEYLVSAKKIPQQTALTIYDSKHYYIQNPLVLKKWHLQQATSEEVFSEGENLTIYIGKKKVPFIHYQSTFSSYAACYSFQRAARFPRKMIEAISAFDINETTFKTSAVFKILMKLRTASGQINREDIIKTLMYRRHGAENLYLVDLLNLFLKL